jgi:hypothetical protein
MNEPKRRGRPPRIEGALNEAFVDKYPEAKFSGGPLSSIVLQFKETHPELWEGIRLCPLQHGLEAMIETLEHG